MTFQFKPAKQFTDRHGLFVALIGGTNSGKSFSALRLARGIAGPGGKIAVADTEGGRILHLRESFDFDVVMLDAPHRPERYAALARDAEQAGYAALVVDSFSAEWVGLGGVLDWHDAEMDRMSGGDAAKRERVKMAAWIAPKRAHKVMMYSLLERRIPIIFSIRGEQSVKADPGQRPVQVFNPLCDKRLGFEVTVSFRLAQDRKGILDLSDPASFKMEGAHRAIFRDGEQISEDHGARLAEWSRGRAADDAPHDAPPAPAAEPDQRAVFARIRAGIAEAEDAEELGRYWADVAEDVHSLPEAGRAKLSEIAHARAEALRVSS